MNKLDQIVAYDFSKEVFEVFVGDEARTFHKSDRSKPLLSISRILRPLTEHKYWRIPKLNLLPNRLIGSLSHRLIEQSFKEKKVCLLNGDLKQLQDLIGKDWDLFGRLKNEVRNKIVNNVNAVVDMTFKILIKQNINIIASEKYICNNSFHGYIDLIGYIDGRPCILELKTSSLDNPKYETNLQLGMYKDLIGIETLETYAIRFNLKHKKVNFDVVNTDDFKLIKHLYERLA